MANSVRSNINFPGNCFSIGLCLHIVIELDIVHSDV